MKRQRLLLSLATAFLASSLLLPVLAAADGPRHRGDDDRYERYDKYDRYDRYDRWEPPRHAKRHRRHDHDRYSRIYVQSPPPPPRVIYRDPPPRHRADNGLTIIYRGAFD
ncbi:hypothetical protein CCR95_13070 [Thiocystis minor]|uniref:hypothetical protein n=1 Tax=Thiocystis minor TaxID=61597 RepID=UPI001912B596|nr:hypothetical protein [Thiocystis minor]MBK5964989.1 hypothetical protein [Thiocystis minor]